MYKKEISVIKSFIKEKSIIAVDEVISIFYTLEELLFHYPKEVNEFDLAGLLEFMSGKAKEFYDRFKNKSGEGKTRIEKNPVYLFEFGSITLYNISVPLLYPLILISLPHYQNSIHLLCQRLGKNNKITLVDFLENYIKIFGRCRPKIDKWDVRLLKEIASFDFSQKNYYRKLMKYEGVHYKGHKRYKKLIYLQILSLYYAVNYPLLNLIPCLYL
ncbi:MAG: hypothetical protein ACFFD4_33290, partial [Candidatus Odinarchaeota archaeon]